MINATQVHGNNQQANEYLAGWQRARAELANVQRRATQQHSLTTDRLKQELVTSLLSLADNFQAITEHVPDDLDQHAWTQGVLHVARQFEQILSEYGVTTITAVNHDFDPVKHEAVEQTASKKVSSGTVVEVVQPGYMMGTTILRPAKVKVAK